MTHVRARDPHANLFLVLRHISEYYPGEVIAYMWLKMSDEQNTKPLYIFDLDGTLALIHHRREMLLDKSNPRRWQQFYAACVKDAPNPSVISTLWTLYNGGAEIWIWSGRSDEVYIETGQWLLRFIQRDGVNPISAFRMRKEHDYQPDNKLKERWLLGLSSIDRARLVATFDDRNRIVDMYRSHGITCYQVAPGDF